MRPDVQYWESFLRVAQRPVTLFAATLAMAFLPVLPSPGAVAADLAGSCCSDLEGRVAELEATVARKGNRKVSLTVAGQVNKAILFWDDGFERNAYVVGNKNDQTHFDIIGHTHFAPGWVSGFELTLRVRDDLSDDVDQGNSNGSREPFDLWHAYWFIESDGLGKISLGRASRVSDTAPENDLSETAVSGYAGMQDLIGAFRLLRTDGLLLGRTWGDVINHFNGDTANIARYDTPEFAGFVASASWGEDDIWDVGLTYEGDGAGFKLAASLAYTEATDGDFLFGDRSTLVGSAAILHESSGFNALVSAGEMQFDGRPITASGGNILPSEASFLYAKIGWIANLNGLGATAFYGEYGIFENLLQTLVVPAAPPGANAQVTSGSDAGIWGLGVVQHIEAADMQIYLGYRRYAMGLEAQAGATAPVIAFENFHTVIVGSKIAF